MAVRTGFFNPMFGPYLARREREDGVALGRPDLVRDADWERSEYVRDYHRPVGCDSILYCYRSVPGDPIVASGVILARRVGVRDFSARAKAAVREAHALVGPLLGGPLARFGEPSPAGLPPRVRQVLRRLLEGDADKQVARRLGLSPHTVNQYVKLVYRHFGVASRPELLARWVRRGWGRGFAWAD